MHPLPAALPFARRHLPRQCVVGTSCFNNRKGSLKASLRALAQPKPQTSTKLKRKPLQTRFSFATPLRFAGCLNTQQNNAILVHRAARKPNQDGVLPNRAFAPPRHFQAKTFAKPTTNGTSATRRHCVLQTAPCCFMRPFELFRLPIDGVYRQPCPFVQIFDLGIKGYTAAQRARLKMIKPTFFSHAGKLRCEVGAYCV